jgi:hypothetical protein
MHPDGGGCRLTIEGVDRSPRNESPVETKHGRSSSRLDKKSLKPGKNRCEASPPAGVSTRLLGYLGADSEIPDTEDGRPTKIVNRVP